MDDLYRDEILELYRRPHNFGTLPNPDASYEGSNPLCDRLRLTAVGNGDYFVDGSELGLGSHADR